jgi:hypothetical protein
MRTCPHCHQTITVERLGVRLPKLKAEIVDAIRRAGDPGITSQELIYLLWHDDINPSTVKAHMWQINSLLEGTDWTIRSDRKRWTLCRRRS